MTREKTMEHQCLTFAPGDPDVERLGLGAPAIRLQYLGYAVLPLAPLTKRPHRMLGSSGGVHHASQDPAWAQHWWSQDRLAGIGVATGAVSGLVVVDLDVKGDANGRVEFGKFMLENRLAVPPDVMAHTPSGGWHIWLRTPPGMAVPHRNSILPGVDIKGDGGYVVAAPTHIETAFGPHSGDRGGVAVLPYSWASGCPCQVPWAPQWLIDWIYTTKGTGAAGHYDGETPELATLLEKGLARGERNVTLYRLACSRYRKHGTSVSGDQIVRSELAAVIAATDTSGFSRTEIERTIASAREWVAAQEADDAAPLESWERWLRGGGG